MTTEGRIYFGRRNKRGDVTVLVYYPNGDEACPLEHYNVHSPGGFEWGYQGSGPSDLAIALLVDHLGIHGEARAAAPNLRFPVSPHDLKDEFVAVLSREPGTWVITTAELDKWIKGVAVPTDGLELPERGKRGWCRFCGGPHTMHSGNPFSHSVGCVVKPWSGNWQGIPEYVSATGDDPATDDPTAVGHGE